MYRVMTIWNYAADNYLNVKRIMNRAFRITTGNFECDTRQVELLKIAKY